MQRGRGDRIQSAGGARKEKSHSPSIQMEGREDGAKVVRVVDW